MHLGLQGIVKKRVQPSIKIGFHYRVLFGMPNMRGQRLLQGAE